MPDTLDRGLIHALPTVRTLETSPVLRNLKAASPSLTGRAGERGGGR
ncbi:hypothetical protein OH768_12675 [Streptomyces sp. NBC_01622]|nr:hypothetical protein OH768_12675 [Streptomyces sp. NBC_01622]